MKIRHIAAVLAAACVAITPVVAAQARTSSVSIGNCTTEGQFVSCDVQGDIHHPASITVKFWAVPGQKVAVFWDDFCSNGSTTGSRSGHFTVFASAAHPVSRTIPLAAGHSGTCTPDVSVSPDGRNGIGRVHLLLHGTN
jgi:hypothetical protein